MNGMFLAATTMNFGERAAYFGKMILIGMGTVFVALTILWGVLVLFRLGVEAVQKRGKKTGATPADTAPAAAAKPVQDDGAVVAAITAAITAALAEENGGQAPAFRVVSFRKINTAKRGKN